MMLRIYILLGFFCVAFSSVSEISSFTEEYLYSLPHDQIIQLAKCDFTGYLARFQTIMDYADYENFTELSKLLVEHNYPCYIKLFEQALIDNDKKLRLRCLKISKYLDRDKIIHLLKLTLEHKDYGHFKDIVNGYFYGNIEFLGSQYLLDHEKDLREMGDVCPICGDLAISTENMKVLFCSSDNRRVHYDCLVSENESHICDIHEMKPENFVLKFRDTSSENVWAMNSIKYFLSVCSDVAISYILMQGTLAPSIYSLAIHQLILRRAYNTDLLDLMFLSLIYKYTDLNDDHEKEFVLRSMDMVIDLGADVNCYFSVALETAVKCNEERLISFLTVKHKAGTDLQERLFSNETYGPDDNGRFLVTLMRIIKDQMADLNRKRADNLIKCIIMKAMQRGYTKVLESDFEANRMFIENLSTVIPVHLAVKMLLERQGIDCQSTEEIFTPKFPENRALFVNRGKITGKYRTLPYRPMKKIDSKDIIVVPIKVKSCKFEFTRRITVPRSLKLIELKQVIQSLIGLPDFPLTFFEFSISGEYSTIRRFYSEDESSLTLSEINFEEGDILTLEEPLHDLQMFGLYLGCNIRHLLEGIIKEAFKKLYDTNLIIR